MIFHDAPNKLKIESVWMVISVDAWNYPATSTSPLTHGATLPAVLSKRKRKEGPNDRRCHRRHD